MAQRELKVKITADSKSLNRGINESKKQVSSLGETVKKAGLALAGAFAARAVIKGLKDIVNAASDAQETFSKFDVIYRDVARSAEESFSKLRNEYGLGSKAAKELLANTGDLLTGFGFAGTEALRLSEEVNKLAVDLASFTNFAGGAKGASDALTKALLGERESVKALGISILEEDVKKQVLLNTQKGLIFETERQAKAQATLDIAMRQSQNAIGDYARTSDSFANKSRLLKERANDLSISLGELLLPKITQTTTALVNLATETTKVVNKFKDFLDANSEIINAVSSDKELNFFQKNWAAVNRWFGRTTKGAEEATKRLDQTRKERIAGLDEEIEKYIEAGHVDSDITQAKIKNRNQFAEAFGMELAFLDQINGKWRENKDAIDGANESLKEQIVNLGELGELEAKISKAKDEFTAANSDAERVAALRRLDALEQEKKLLEEIARATITAGQSEFLDMDAVAGEWGVGLFDGVNEEIERTIANMDKVETKTEDLKESMIDWGQIATGAAATVGMGFMQMAKDGSTSVSDIIKQLLSQVTAQLIASIMSNPLIPFPANIGLAAGAGALAGGLFNQIPAFADGGRVTSPTLAMFGEYPGARTNPEYALREDQLRKVAGGGGKLEARFSRDEMIVWLNEGERRQKNSF